MQAVNKYTCGSSSAVRFELTKGLVSKTNQSLQTEQASVWLLLFVTDGSFWMHEKVKGGGKAAAAFVVDIFGVSCTVLQEQTVKVLLMDLMWDIGTDSFAFYVLQAQELQQHWPVMADWNIAAVRCLFISVLPWWREENTLMNHIIIWSSQWFGPQVWVISGA